MADAETEGNEAFEVGQFLEGMVETEEGELDQQKPPEPVDPEIEAEARKFGWKPKDDFNLSPEGWVDAERFLELPSTIRKKNRDLERRVETMAEQQKRLTQAHNAALDRQREKLLAEAQEKKQRAFEAADWKEFSQAEQMERQASAVQSEPPQEYAVVQEYMQSPDGEWLQYPSVMTDARAIIDRGIREGKVSGADFMAQLEFAREKVARVYPNLFQQEQPAQRAQQPRMARVDGGGLGAARPRKKGAASLPPDVKQAAQMYVDDGVFKDLEEYAAEYFKDNP